MTRDDIIREMGWLVPELVESELLNRIERVVRLAEAAEVAKCEGCGKPHALYCLKCCEESIVQTAVKEERKACAKDCETLLPSKRIYDQRYYEAVEDCVATIRARGQNDAT